MALTAHVLITTTVIVEVTLQEGGDTLWIFTTVFLLPTQLLETTSGTPFDVINGNVTVIASQDGRFKFNLQINERLTCPLLGSHDNSRIIILTKSPDVTN